MSNQRTGFLGLFGQSQTIKRWERALQSPGALATRDLAAMREQMQLLRAKVDTLGASAESELLSRMRSDEAIDRPDQCDWAERAGPWRQKLKPRGHVDFGSPLHLGAGVTLFHDAAQADISIRQDRPPRGMTGAAFGLVLDVYRFDGSFLSLVQDLPQSAINGLTLNHYFAVQLSIAREQPVEVYARLNVQHGPNHEQIVRQFDISGDQGLAEFDLAYSNINDKRVEKAWLDLILEGPEMNRIAIWDMVLLRAPRADI